MQQHLRPLGEISLARKEGQPQAAGEVTFPQAEEHVPLGQAALRGAMAPCSHPAPPAGPVGSVDERADAAALKAGTSVPRLQEALPVARGRYTGLCVQRGYQGEVFL